MANRKLFSTSLCCAFIFLLFIIFLRPKNKTLCPILLTLFTIGLLTSVLNHGTTSKMIKFIDRCVMIFGVLYLLLCVKCFQRFPWIYFLLFTVGLYLIAKATNKDSYHACSHFLLLFIILTVVYKC
jgi:hypothetical protein